MAEISSADIRRTGLLHFEGHFYAGWKRALSRDQEDLLRRVITDQVDPYRDLKLPKANGKYRPISAPTDEWMAVLRVFQQRFLSDPKIAAQSAYAYVTGRSAADCARVHLNSEWIVRVDVRDFYHSIGEDRIYFAAKQYGLIASAARVFSRSVTRRPKPPVPAWAPKFARTERSLPYLPRGAGKTRPGFLPQGAPTSGAVSNMVAYGLDLELQSFAQEHGWRYSRYADDLFVSSPVRVDSARQAAGPRDSDLAIRAINGALVRHGFHPNPDKTRVMRKGRRQVVLGLLVDGKVLRPTREKVRHVDFHVYALARFFDWNTHAMKHGFADTQALLRHLEGCISYFRDVNPEWASLLSNRLAQAIVDQQRWEARPPQRPNDGSVEIKRTQSGKKPSHWNWEKDLTERHLAALGPYLSELRNTKRSAQTDHELVEIVKEGGAARIRFNELRSSDKVSALGKMLERKDREGGSAKKELTRRYLPYVVETAYYLETDRVPFEDLVQKSLVRILSNLRRYSPEKHSSFEAFARSLIRSVPVSSRENAPAPAPTAEIREARAGPGALAEALLALHEKLGRAPTIEEILADVRQHAKDTEAP